MPYDEIQHAVGFASIPDLKEALANKFNELAGSGVVVVVAIHDRPERHDFFAVSEAGKFLDVSSVERNRYVDQVMRGKTMCDIDYVGYLAGNGDFEQQFSALKLK